MAATILGKSAWGGGRDAEGHREYKIKYKIACDKLDGPATILQTPGLPLIGAMWNVDNDLDVWAWRRPTTTVTMMEDEGNPNRFWAIELTFSTKPPEPSKRRCQDNQIEDPLLEPQKVSGGFTKFTEEATSDRFGNALNNSAHEPFRGAQVEFDQNRPTVRVEQNVPVLGIPLFAPMIDTVNDATLWGCPRRCVKLSNVSWERKYHGSCYVYYTRTLEFDVNLRTWDRDILDEGTKVLNGRWDQATGSYQLLNVGGAAPNPFNPAHFIQFKDINGENGRVVLNGLGLPAETLVGGHRFAQSAIISGNNGTGYSVGDRIVLAGGTSTQKAVLLVKRVTGSSGAIGGNAGDVVVLVRGAYSVLPANPVAQDSVIGGGSAVIGLVAGASATGGSSGTGATFAVTWGTVQGTFTNIGYAHVERYPESNFLLLGIPTVL